MDPKHRGSRLIDSSFLPIELCQELLFIHRSLAVVGYRPNVQSLTLYDLVLAAPHLLPAVVKARQLVWDRVEEFFGLPCEVWPETTSLINWTAGASIGWHHDANRSYLAARHFSAVAYLTTQGLDFTGGTFCFQEGAEPMRVHPSAGMLLLYTSDDSNVHSVEEVTWGERSTLTMWFTLDNQHQEDCKVLSKLRDHSLAGLPYSMYCLDNGIDVRLARLQQRAGLTIRVLLQRDAQDQSFRHLAEAQPPTSHDHESSCRCCDAAVYVVCCHAHNSQGRCLRDPCDMPADVLRVPTCQDAKVAVAGSCSSLQGAVLLACMLEKLAATDSSTCGSGTHSSSSSYTVRGQCAPAVAAGSGLGGGVVSACVPCRLLDRLPEAQQQLHLYLSQAAAAYQQALPKWGQVHALVSA